MIRIETERPGRARVIGSLAGQSIEVLLNAVSSGIQELDVSEVEAVDERAVEALAALEPRCAVVACPRWLAMWLERVRAGEDQ